MQLAAGDGGEEVRERDVGLAFRHDDDAAIFLADLRRRIEFEVRGLKDAPWDADGADATPFAEGGTQDWLL
jgi:hypothetical protein